MELRRATFAAAVKLAIAFSTMAVIVALTLDAVGDVSVAGMVAVVAVTGFATSWVQTGRIRRAVTVPARRCAPTHHRVSVVPLHQPVG